MSCRPNNVLVSYKVCAIICDKQNDNPLPKFSIFGVNGFDDNLGIWELKDNSTFFDNGTSINRQYKWNVRVNNRNIYSFGFGGFNTLIPELSNGSLYNSLILGTNNTDLINFINSLPNIQLSNQDQIIITLQVKDNTGIQSNTNSNPYIIYV